MDYLDKIDGKRFYSKDGYSLLVMFEDSDTLVIDVCSPNKEQVSEDEFIPEVIGSLVIHPTK